MLMRDDIVLLEFADLVNEACLTIHAYKKAVHDERISIVQRGGNNRPALIDWSSLPERYKELVRANMGGDPAELVKTITIEQHLALPIEDERYIDAFRANNGLMLNTAKRASLKKAARVVALLAELDERGPQAYGFGSVLKMKEVVRQYVKVAGVDLPGSFARLEEKKRLYLQARKEGRPGASALVHGGHGNANCARMVDPLQKATLEKLASRHQNYGQRRIADNYNMIAEAQGWPTLTSNTVANYLSKGEVSRSVTFYAKGAAAYQQKHGIVVRRSRPTKPTLMWVHDGTTYELYFQREVGGKASYHHRKEVCVVLDPHSWYPVGYAIGETDNIELTRAAVKNAVEHMHDLLGAYVVPYQVQSDRLGHKALGRWYDEMGVTYTPAKSRNARAKVIEPYFKHHHQQYVQPHYANWSGHNITSAVRNQPNPDALERGKKQFPDEANVIAQIHEAFARERAAKAQEFLGALHAMQPEMLRTVDRSRFIELFGVEHPWENTLTNRGVVPTLLGEERVYNLLTHDFQDHVGTSFRVVYDPSDLSDVLLVALEGSLRYLVPSVEPIPMALADHTPETRALLARVEGYKKELGQQAIDRPIHQGDQVRALASRLLESTVVRKLEPEPSTATPGPMEEAVIRSYGTTKGSHKVALTEAREQDDLRFTNPEAWAEEQF